MRYTVSATGMFVSNELQGHRYLLLQLKVFITMK